MPFPIIPAIAAGSNLLGAGVQAFAQGKMNKKTRQWSLDMYNKQRMDAIADWNMQNEYNSPLATMQRLKEAGINPRTYFTQGMQSEASQVRMSPVENWKPQTADFQGGIAGAGSSLLGYYDVQVKQAQIDNLEAQNELIRMQSLLTNYKAAKEGSDLRMTEGADAGNLYETGLLTQLEAAKGAVRKQNIEADVLLSRNEREALTNVQSLQEGIERIAALRLGRQLTKEQINSLNKDNQLKQLDIQLRKQFNIGPGDPLYVRLIALMLDKMGIKP